MRRLDELNRDQLHDIVGDLLTCIRYDRLRDATYGWELHLSKKGYAIPKPCLLEPHAPSWNSLKRHGLMDSDGGLIQ